MKSVDATATATATATPVVDEYFVLQPDFRDGMLLAPIAKAPNRQSWTAGVRFSPAPPQPIEVKIRDGYETAQPRPFVGVPPIMSDELHQVLSSAGVSNIDVYEAVLKSADGSVVFTGYKAFNLIGMVEAADLSASKFAPENASRFMDASFDSLVLDGSRLRGLLMFRLAEFTSAVLVHRSVKAAIEAAGVTHINFVKPSEFLS
jgi:hypothetical protein